MFTEDERSKAYESGYSKAASYYAKRLEEEQQRREIWMKDRLRGLLVAMENIDKIYPFEEKYDGCIKFLRNLNEKDKGWI